MSSKSIPFTKMVGAGNDFIVIEARPGLNYQKLTRAVCDRTNGIGADGLLILDKSRVDDFRMRIINADGSEAEMCGNGARCMAAYIVLHKKPGKKFFTLETLAGTIMAEAKDQVANVRLSDPRDYRPGIAVPLADRTIHVHYIDTGVPHAVIFVDGLARIDVNAIGPSLRYHKLFAPRGTNVNFVEQIGEGLVAVRTYERGVEAETRACGTGSVASALIAYMQSHPGAITSEIRKARMKVRTCSGEVLSVVFDVTAGRVVNVWLKGSGRFIAAGEYFL